MRSNSRALTIDEVRARFEEWRKNRAGEKPHTRRVVVGGRRTGP